MKKALLSVLLIIGLLLVTPYLLHGQFPRIYGTSGNDGINKVIPAGTEYYVLGYTGANPNSTWKATISRLNSSGSVIWTKSLDIFSQWNDGIVTPNGDLLVVGTTLPYSTSSQSLMGLINSSGTFTWVRSSNASGREILNRIVLNPVPQNTSFPYYVMGEYYSGSGRDIILMTFNANGNTGWKKRYPDSNTYNFSQDLEILPNGDLLMTGGVIFRADNTGQIYNAAAIEGQFRFGDVSQKSGGGFYAVGSEGGNFTSQLIKFDPDFIPVWQIAIPNLQGVSQVWSIGNDIYVTASRSIGPMIQGVLLKFRDNGTSPAYLWTKYLKLNEPSPFGFSSVGFTTYLPPNKIAYADARRRTNGYGFDDGFISVSDLDFNTCMTQLVTDNFQVKDNLFFSPLPLSIEFVDVPPSTAVASSSLTWSDFDACLTDCTCAFSSMQILGPLAHQVQQVTCGGAPVTLSCLPGTGYTFTGVWGGCPTIRSIMINSCSTEEANEFLIIHSGGKGFNVNDLKIDFDNSVNITGSQNNDINTGTTPCGFIAGNAAMISGCPNVISAGPGTLIPANAYVIVQTSSAAASGGLYDFSAFCNTLQPLYVIRSSCARSADAFPNTGTGTVSTVLSVAGSCSSVYTYDKTSLSNLNGDYFISPSTYGNTGCTAPPAALVSVSPAIQVNWTLSGPGATQSGAYNGSGPFFSINLLPLYFTQPGLYTLTLQGKCGDKICPCIVQFNVNCPDPCPCTSTDLLAFREDVDKGFASTFTSSSCKVCFSPIGLSGCETVEWFTNPNVQLPIGTSTGKQTFCYTFSAPGTYNVKMQVTRNKSDGSICEIFAKTQTVTVTCGPMAPTGSPLLKNSSFNETPVAGGLTTGGSAPGWSAAAGDPVLVGSVSGSQDGWGIAISGNASASDVLSSIETVCISSTENGTLSLRLRTWGDPHETTGDGVREKPKKGKMSIQMSSGQGTGCPGGNCITLASVDYSLAIETDEWYEVRIPFNLSDWTVLENCSSVSGGIPVRIFVGVTNDFTDNQGDGYNRSAILIDNLSFNILNTGVETRISTEGELSIYPNPTTGYFTLEMANEPAHGTTIRIIKASGQVVLEKQAQAGECIQTFDSASMPAGLYFVQVLTEGKLVAVEKLVKQ